MGGSNLDWVVLRLFALIGLAATAIVLLAFIVVVAVALVQAL